MTQVVTGPVVVGVDGSASATQAVHWAALEAARRGVPLVLLHVWTPVPVSVPHGAMLGGYEDGLIAQGNQWLAQAAAVAQDAAPGLTTGTRLSSGSVAGLLIGRSASAGLLVLGSRGLGGFTGLLAGSTAVAVAAHGHCPVVIVRGAGLNGESKQARPVVVGVDGSAAAAWPVRFAFEAASRQHLPLLAVHAWSDLPLASGWDATVGWQAIQRAEAEVLAGWLGTFRTEHTDVRVEQVVVQDRPVHALLDLSTTARLIVVGSRGRGGFRGLLLGSTSQALVYHSACPVAVVPAGVTSG